MSIKVLTKNEIDEQKDYIKKIYPLMNGKKYHIYTMGCQLNENESEKLSGMITEMGYILTENPEEADLVFSDTYQGKENQTLIRSFDKEKMVKLINE